jgi:hypothetical protein
MKNPTPNSHSFSNLSNSFIPANTFVRLLLRVFSGFFLLNLGFSQHVIAKQLRCPIPPSGNNKDMIKKHPKMFICMINEEGKIDYAFPDLTYPAQQGIDDSGLKAPVSIQTKDH